MDTKNYPDHHIYTKNDLIELEKIKLENEAQALITTEKDAVKLKTLIDDKAEIYALKLKPVLDLKSILEE